MKSIKYFVPAGFTPYTTKNGFFIKNSRDGKVFKWISVKRLSCNGYDSNGNLSKYGRRQFDGHFSCQSSLEELYQDPEAKEFEESVKKSSGFYISVKKEDPCYKHEADEHAKNYLIESIDAKSLLPCGAAFDCMFENIYERFLRSVILSKTEHETLYEAWNRISEIRKISFLKNGIYGIHGLMDHKYEHTSECVGELCCAYRGEFRMCLISYARNESRVNHEYVSWCLGLRNYCHENIANFGYRIVILSK